MNSPLIQKSIKIISATYDKASSFVKNKLSKSRLKGIIEQFSYCYDVISKVLKTGFVFLIFSLLYIHWDKIDAYQTQLNLIEGYVAIQSNEVETTKPTKPEDPVIEIDKDHIYQDEKIIFTLYKEQDLSTESCFFEKLLVNGTPDYKGEFMYKDVKFKITNIQEYIGLLIGEGKAEGPVLKGVQCVILNK